MHTKGGGSHAGKTGVYDQRSSYTYTNLLRVSQCLNEPEAEVEAIYKEAVEKLPKEPDFDCVMGTGTGERGNMKKRYRCMNWL